MKKTQRYTIFGYNLYFYVTSNVFNKDDLELFCFAHRLYTKNYSVIYYKI